MEHASELSPLSHQGYMDGLTGKEPKNNLSYRGSEYDEGWLIGDQDRVAGVVAPKYLGHSYESELPVKKGMEIIIPKGVTIRTIYHGTRVNPRSYKIRVNHVLGGSVGYKVGGSDFVKPTVPEVRWAGKGGYWSSVDLNQVLEANGLQ